MAKVRVRKSFSSVWGVSLTVGLMLSCSACTAWGGGKQAISPHRNTYPSASGASSLAPIPTKTVITSRRNGKPRYGIVIPVPEARQTVFRFLSREPVLLMDATTVSAAGQPENTPAILKTVGPVLLSNGLEIGSECAEHLRIGDTVAHGAFCNGGKTMVRVQLGSGLMVTLKPSQGIYVGDDYYAVKVYDRVAPVAPPDNGSRDATHTIECVCTCHADAGDEENRFACGARCIDPGNQCEGLNGNSCTVTDSHGDPQPGEERDCHEVVVPIAHDDTPVGIQHNVGRQPR